MSVKKIVFNELINPAECLQQIISAYTEYKIIAEQEQTKRRAIEAWEKVTIANINARRDLLIRYLDRAFDERLKTFVICLLWSIMRSRLAITNN